MIYRARSGKGINPEWANLPRRKCDDCGKSYKPVRPKKPDERGFCSDNCRKSFHKHGGPYRKVLPVMRKLMEREFDKLNDRLREIVREEMRAIDIEAGLRRAKAS